MSGHEKLSHYRLSRVKIGQKTSLFVQPKHIFQSDACLNKKKKHADKAIFMLEPKNDLSALCVKNKTKQKPFILRNSIVFCSEYYLIACFI